MTLRSDNVGAVESFYLKEIGMNKLSEQEVEKYNFSLLFYAFTDEDVPNKAQRNDKEIIEARFYFSLCKNTDMNNSFYSTASGCGSDPTPV